MIWWAGADLNHRPWRASSSHKTPFAVSERRPNHARRPAPTSCENRPTFVFKNDIRRSTCPQTVASYHGHALERRVEPDGEDVYDSCRNFTRTGGVLRLTLRLLTSGIKRSLG